MPSVNDGATMQRFYAVTKYALISLTLLCCDEELPPRGDPDNLITSKLVAQYNGAPNNTSILSNGYDFYVTIKNNYDETLQGYGLFGGGLEIIWEENPNYRKTVHFDKSMIMDTRRYKYDPVENIVTMDPGDELTFFYRWDFVTDDGDTLPWKHFTMTRDDQCPIFRWIPHAKYPSGFTFPRWYSKNTFQIRASIKVFREFSVSYAPSVRQEIEYETFRKQFCGSFGG